MKFYIGEYKEVEGKRCSRCFKQTRIRPIFYLEKDLCILGSDLGILGSYCDDCFKFLQENYFK